MNTVQLVRYETAYYAMISVGNRAAYDLGRMLQQIETGQVLSLCACARLATRRADVTWSNTCKQQPPNERLRPPSLSQQAKELMSILGQCGNCRY
jgi:hypothetical protein